MTSADSGHPPRASTHETEFTPFGSLRSVWKGFSINTSCLQALGLECLFLIDIETSPLTFDDVTLGYAMCDVARLVIDDDEGRSKAGFLELLDELVLWLEAQIPSPFVLVLSGSRFDPVSSQRGGAMP